MVLYDCSSVVSPCVVVAVCDLGSVNVESWQCNKTD